jgi:hypothetical protein
VHDELADTGMITALDTGRFQLTDGPRPGGRVGGPQLARPAPLAPGVDCGRLPVAG